MAQREKRSAGLLMYRRTTHGELEVLLAHPGGPLFARKDAGAWTIPKGELEAGEEPHPCALREFAEETGWTPQARDYLALGTVQQRGGKWVSAWAFEGDWDVRELRSNTFQLEWPPRSGRMQAFPEIDRVAFFPIELARAKINPAQIAFLDRLLALAGGS
jgi:predicted NUDIX family NTP pyrophosphohydrolase